MGSQVGIPMTHQSTKPPLCKELTRELLLESLNTYVQDKSIALGQFS